MNISVNKLIDIFSDLKVLVIGEGMLDRYMRGHPQRICREAPVPVVSLNDIRDYPGGAANTALNLAALGAETRFLTVIGDDPHGQVLKNLLQNGGVRTEGVIGSSDHATLTKTRVLADSHILVRFDEGNDCRLKKKTQKEFLRRLEELYPSMDAVLISDYNYGLLSPRILNTIRDLQKRTPRVLACDARRPGRYDDLGLTVIKPNYQEAVQWLNLPKLASPSDRVEQILKNGERLLKKSGAAVTAVTLDSEGALIFEKGRPSYRTYAPAVATYCSGAGDTFISALTLALTRGEDTTTAAELASAASAIVVGKEATASCSIEELFSHLSRQEKYIKDPGDLGALCALHKNKGRKIVFTNGCFDILHRGHVTHLSRCKELGDILVVGVNSDESVRRLKGEQRPINQLEDRVKVLSALSCVDFVAGFEEDTPEKIIRTIVPDIYAKGGDYTREFLPEVPLVESLGGEVRILPYHENYSTSKIITTVNRHTTSSELHD